MAANVGLLHDFPKILLGLSAKLRVLLETHFQVVSQQDALELLLQNTQAISKKKHIVLAK